MRVPALPISRQAIGYLLAATLFLLALVDGGSLVLTRLAVPDDVRAAGHAAADAVVGMPATRQTVVVAYDAAAYSARKHGLSVRRKDFTVYPDGRVTLTASRTAPTLLADRVPALRNLVVVNSTATVEALPYS